MKKRKKGATAFPSPRETESIRGGKKFKGIFFGGGGGGSELDQAAQEESGTAKEQTLSGLFPFQERGKYLEGGWERRKGTLSIEKGGVRPRRRKRLNGFLSGKGRVTTPQQAEYRKTEAG